MDTFQYTKPATVNDATTSVAVGGAIQRVLARVIGLFSGRGYNIDSLTVSETEHEKHLSRITIVTTGTKMVIEQIKAQLDRSVGQGEDQFPVRLSPADDKDGQAFAASAAAASRSSSPLFTRMRPVTLTSSGLPCPALNRHCTERPWPYGRQS